MMEPIKRYCIPLAMSLLLLVGALPARAGILVQCPGDLNGDAIPDPFLLNNNGTPSSDPNPDYDPNVKCMHLGAGDGFVTMGDGHLQYIFSFSDLTGIKDDPATTTYDERADAGMLAATFPAPTITVDEGKEFYLSLSNVGMMMRPDLFDPHTVHWHGFPNAASVFDGVPDASISINMGFSLTYYYHVVEPGTYMYHCHVEATEHMQMGMLGNLYVRPIQNATGYGGNADTISNIARRAAGQAENAASPEGYVYNDADGSTAYDKEFPIQIGSFDSYYHDEHLAVQPLPFYYMRDDYPMLNGRGYPDTVNPNPLPVPMDENGDPLNANMTNMMGTHSQKMSSLITAAPGDRVLLRISNLNVTRFYTLGTLGLRMKIVGMNARLLRGPSPDGGTTPGRDLYYTTNSVTLGGGESLDAIVEIPATATSGTRYFLYTTNLNYLSNSTEDFGGIMTEIRVN